MEYDIIINSVSIITFWFCDTYHNRRQTIIAFDVENSWKEFKKKTDV